LATLGKRGQDLINLIKPANDLSIALGASSDEAAEFLVQNLNAFGASSNEAANYADVIATIRTSTSLDFQRMRDSFQYLAPISRILGEDIAYTGGVIGLLSDNGLKAEQAARLLGTAQQKLAKDGISLTDALNQINEAQANGAEGLELLSLASDLFGKQAAKVGVLLATNQGQIQEYADTIRNSSGALDDLVNEQLKSLDAQIKILDSTWERFILTIENGEGSYARFFKGVSQGLTGWLEELTEIEEAQSNVFEISGAEKGLFDRIKPLFPLLNTIKSDYEEIVDLQREFNRFYDTLDSNTSLGFLKDEVNTLNKVLEENNDLTDEQRKLYEAQRDRVQELYEANLQNREELEKTASEIVKASGHFENYGNKIEILTNEQLEDFIRKNKGLLKTVEDINEEFNNQEFESLNSLNKKLEELRVRYSSIDHKSAEFDLIKTEIEELEAYIAKITGKNKKKTIKLLEGTVAAYQAEIKKLEELRDTTATTTEEYEKFNDEIFKLERNIKNLTEGIDELRKVEEFFTRGITADINPFGEITAPDYTEISTGLINETIKQEEKRAAMLRSLRKGELEDFKDFTDEETKILEDALDLQQRLREQKQQATEDLIFGGVQAIFDARVESVNKELDALDEYYDALLDREGLTSDEIVKIQRQKELEEEKLQRKREKREKEAFLIQQGIAIAQIAIDLAKTITAINVTAAALDAVSLGTLGTPYRATNIPVAITTAALQTGLVLAQSIPQFFKGKDPNDNYEGLATVNELPGQREVKIDKYGGVTAYKAGMQFDYVKSDDIIIPSMSKFNREIKDPDSDVFKRLSKRVHQETNERTQAIFIDTGNQSISTDGIRKEIRQGIREGFKGLKNPKFPENFSRY
jgi:TP901 family phage tail tape measure protein